VREIWNALNKFCIEHGGSVVSVPGTVLRIECPKDSALPVKLGEFGYDVCDSAAELPASEVHKIRSHKSM
jgi:hypothetical protein